MGIERRGVPALWTRRAKMDAAPRHIFDPAQLHMAHARHVNENRTIRQG